MKVKEQIQGEKEFLKLISRFSFFDRAGRLYLNYANLYLSEVKKIEPYSYLGFLFFFNRENFIDFNKAVLSLKKAIDEYDDRLESDSVITNEHGGLIFKEHEKGEGSWDKLVEFEKAMLNLGDAWDQMETTLFWNTLSKRVERKKETIEIKKEISEMKKLKTQVELL